MGNLVLAPEEKDIQRIVDASRQLSMAADGLNASIAALQASMGLTWLASATASASATVDFTGIDSTYDAYLFFATNLVAATNNVELWVRISEDGGSTFKAGASDYHWASFVTTDAATNASTGSAADAKFKLTAANIGNAATTPVSCQMRLFGPSGTAGPKNMASETSYLSSLGALLYNTASGIYTADNGAINAIRFMFSSGNITSGKISMYGLKK